MNGYPHIPSLEEINGAALERLREFIEKHRTGQITLNLKDGKVRSIDFRECVPVDSR